MTMCPRPFISKQRAGIRRIERDEALALYQSSIHEIGERAGAVAEQLHPGGRRSYVIERNINYTNVCRCRCLFCAFSVSRTSEEAYVLSVDEIAEKIRALVDLGGRQILLQGGLHPELSLNWYEELLRGIKERFGELHVHGFSPPEIVFLAKQHHLAVEKVIERLHAAGLDSIPGGGAEILVDRVRNIISPAKCSVDEWLNVMRQAHRQGIYTTATMMFGHVETVGERIDHFERLRRVQDESLEAIEKMGQGGCFTSFTCWPFQPGLTALAKKMSQASSLLPDGGEGGGSGGPAGAFEYLRTNALARLYLDNIDNFQASWVTQGPKIAQLSLLMGCNDLGSLMMEENVVSAAGTVFDVNLGMIRELIRQAGFDPVQRDYYYREMDEGE